MRLLKIFRQMTCLENSRSYHATYGNYNALVYLDNLSIEGIILDIERKRISKILSRCIKLYSGVKTISDKSFRIFVCDLIKGKLSEMVNRSQFSDMRIKTILLNVISAKYREIVVTNK